MPIKRRPSLNKEVAKGLPMLTQAGMHLPMDKSNDSPQEKELRAAIEYVLELYYWYREQTMNFQYSLRGGKKYVRRQKAYFSLSNTPSAYMPLPPL